jgi:hypothetical protein
VQNRDGPAAVTERSTSDPSFAIVAKDFQLKPVCDEKAGHLGSEVRRPTNMSRAVTLRRVECC